MAAELHKSPASSEAAGRWHIEKIFYLRPLRGLVDTQIGPIYLGVPGIIAIVCFAVCCFTILMGYMTQVGFNPLRFVREFGVLAVYPPSAAYGLAIAPMEKGGYWQIATFFLSVTIYCWLGRIWERAIAHKLRPLVAITFSSAVLLFSAIYIIHPITVGTWADAPGHGLKAQLDWVNYFSLKYGNFFYNPFHMFAIFCLLGSTVVLAMHGATILAVLAFNAHRELDEIEETTEGTQRAQLFWRWTMGFNATAHSIHTWALVFGALVGVFGAIGVIASGTAEPSWFLWACRAGIAPTPQLACPLP